MQFHPPPRRPENLSQFLFFLMGMASLFLGYIPNSTKKNPLVLNVLQLRGTLNFTVTPFRWSPLDLAILRERSHITCA